MDKNFYTPENIEAYLENRLSPSERGLFENGVSKDPLVKNEVGLQKDIIDSLKNYRKSELKNRLNNIEVSLTPNYSGIKIAASIVVSGLIGFGIYTYVNSSSNTNIADNREVYIPNPVSESPKSNSIQDISTKENTGNNEMMAPSVKENTSPSGNNITTSKSSSAIVKSNKEITKVERSSPMVTESFEGHEQFEKDNNISLPDGKVAQITETKSGLDISIDRTTDKKFHYKYYNNKLFLFGNFDSKTYEILELNTYKGKKVYLYYDKSYYELNSNQIDITPLSKITDEKAIEALNKLNK